MHDNETLELLHSHRSIRSYQSTPVDEAHVLAAVQAGQAAATSSAVQAYSLLQVADPDTRAKIVPLTGGQTKVAESGAFFVVCGDVRRHRIACGDAGTGYDARLEAFLVAAVDASLFAQNLVIAFESLGYGTCYIGGLRNQLRELDALLDVPHGVYPLCGLCVGVGAESPAARPRLPVDAVFTRDRFPSDDEVRASLAEYDARYREYLASRGSEPRGWTDGLTRMFAQPARAYLADYYRSKGGDLG